MSVHVLIIDDDPLANDILGRLIRQQGATYTLVADPSHVDAVLDDISAIDMVFLDLEMPKLSGYDLLPMLQERLPHVPIIGCSVHTSESVTAMNMGFQAFIGKPLDPAKFPSAWSRILSGERFRLVQ